MLQGVLLEMSLVEHRGGEAGLLVGLSSGSTMGIEYAVGLVRAVGFWAYLLVWDAGRGWGHVVLFVPWLVQLMGWPAPLVMARQVGCFAGK